MDNIRRIIFALLAFMGIVSLNSCSDDSIITDADNQSEEQTHTMTLKLSCGLRNFDSSRAEDYEWKDGDKIYLVFTSDNSTVSGTAEYDAGNDAWSVTYKGELPQGASAKCEAYYFDGAGEELGTILDKVVVDKWRKLFNTTAIYADKNATYICENNAVAVYAILSPTTGRLRFRGVPGTVFTVSGINYFDRYDIYKNDLQTLLVNCDFTDSIGADGYSPYFYGYFSEESTKEINIRHFDGEFMKSLTDNALTAGHSGCLTLPTADNHIGWFFKGNTLDISVNGVTFKMKLVEAGTFTMGASSEQTGAYDDEKPAHQVTLTKDYYMGETEVTQTLWYAVMGQKPTTDSNYQWYEENGLGDNYPAYYISWDDCQEFINKLNQLTGLTFRLPTEAEWEYAARGGNKATTQTLYSGSNAIGNVAWYTDNSSSSTHIVAGKAANELGLYDMSGNVWEWCYDDMLTYSSNMQIDPIGPTSGTNRVYRGGSWNNDARSCRVSRRLSFITDSRYLNLGLRLALQIYDGKSSNYTTIDFSTLGLENATAVTNITMSDGTVLTFGSGTNTTNAPKYYTATGGVRMYANNTLNVKASGKTITGVKLTCDSYNGTDYVGNDTLNGKSGSTTVNPSVSGTTVTFSGFSGSELLITNAYAQASGGVQLRVKTVTVYYAE